MLTVLTQKINTFSQEIYDKIVDNIEFSTVTCTCGHKGCLKKHGYYKRSLRFKSEKYSVLILRVKCSQCGRTHAILLDLMVPYSQIPLDDQVSIIKAHELGGDIMDVINENFLIDPSEVYRIVRNYIKHWKQRLISASITLTESITKDCFRTYSMQFMQIRSRKGCLIY